MGLARGANLVHAHGMPDSEDSREREARDLRRRLRNLAALGALLASVTTGIALQGIVKGGQAETDGIILLVLSGLLGPKSLLVANSLAEDTQTEHGKRKLWLRLTLGERDRFGVIALMAALGMVVCAVLTVQATKRPSTNYQSAYDGVDPGNAHCDGDNRGDGTVIATDGVTAGSVKVGTLELELSKLCGTHWARMQFQASAVPRLRRSSITLQVIRPIDATVESYSLTPSKRPYMWGNMVGGGECAYAEVSDVGHAGSLPAFQSRTACRDVPVSPGG